MRPDRGPSVGCPALGAQQGKGGSPCGGATGRAPLYCASSSPPALSSRRMHPSRQLARTQLPSCDSARLVTGLCSWSAHSAPARASKRRTLPSTLPARISALQGACGPVAQPCLRLQPFRSGPYGPRHAPLSPCRQPPSGKVALDRAARLPWLEGSQGTHLAETATEVTESAKGLQVWMASQERDRVSHTRTA